MTDTTVTREPLLKLDKVSFRYPNSQKDLLKKVSFELYPGQTVGIVGDNGTGKSTITKLILGLCRPQGKEAKVELFGQPVSWGNHYPQLGYIGDPSHNPGETGLPTGISVGEVVECFRQLWDSPLKEELIDILELKALFESEVGKLSTGERKRLMVFLALAKNTKLLIADEATEGLDKNAKPRVLDLVRDISRHQDFSLLWISHRRDEIAFLTNEVYELSPNEKHIGELIRLPIKGFNCQVETDSDEYFNGQSHQDKDGLLSVIGNIFLNPSVSRLKITGIRNQEEE